MNPHYTYLLIDLGSLFFPFIFSFDKKVAFYRLWPGLLPAMAITAAVFILWDIAFTAQGIWWFSRDYTLPIRLFGLPIEEWLFFFIVPYCCAFIWATLNAYFPPHGPDKGWPWAIALAALLLLIAALNASRAYTCCALGGCGAALAASYFLRKKTLAFRADRFLTACCVCLLPFLIVNGLLTSLPVVMYDDGENTGLRIYTIPAEDIFYGMLLVQGNIWGLCFADRRRHAGNMSG